MKNSRGNSRYGISLKGFVSSSSSIFSYSYTSEVHLGKCNSVLLSVKKREIIYNVLGFSSLLIPISVVAYHSKYLSLPLRIKKEVLVTILTDKSE